MDARRKGRKRKRKRYMDLVTDLLFAAAVLYMAAFSLKLLWS